MFGPTGGLLFSGEGITGGDSFAFATQITVGYFRLEKPRKRAAGDFQNLLRFGNRERPTGKPAPEFRYHRVTGAPRARFVGLPNDYRLAGLQHVKAPTFFNDERNTFLREPPPQSLYRLVNLGRARNVAEVLAGANAG